MLTGPGRCILRIGQKWSRPSGPPHYEKDPVLQRYFRAMMWLGRVDLRFLELDPFTGEWTFHDRQLADAWLLNAAAEGSGAVEGLAKADAILRALVGEVDYITLHGVASLAEAHSFDTLASITTLDDTTRALLTDELLSGVWGEQKINSHWLETDPFSAETTPLPPAFAFFGQRFTVDSHVFSNVVYDHIVKDGQKLYRRLPSPLDVLFVLGNSQVLPHLLGELTDWQYQGNLHTLRFLVDWYDESFWSSNAYNLWLSALRGMNEPTTGAIYPEPMRTPAWRDRVMNTQLASWAQLRHDTLLYVKQSYTGGAGCDYPDGWVDAYPALWKALGDMADPIALAVQGTPAATQVGPFLENWKTVMGTLQVIAQKELDGSSLSEDEKDFLHSVLYGHGGECPPAPRPPHLAPSHLAPRRFPRLQPPEFAPKSPNQRPCGFADPARRYVRGPFRTAFNREEDPQGTDRRRPINDYPKSHSFRILVTI